MVVRRAIWSYGNLEYPGWYFGVLANVNITIVSAILHGVDYHSNNLNQKTNLDLSCPQVEHDPPSAGPPARRELRTVGMAGQQRRRKGQ